MPRKTKAKKSIRGKTKAHANNVVPALSIVLADLYVLAIKSHGFHWNVEGPLFPQLHELFGKQYEALTSAADDVAERIRALGETAPGSFTQFARLSNIQEETKMLPANKMIAMLLVDYEILAADIQGSMNIADDADDDGSEDLLTGLLRDVHKTLWMLRAMLQAKV